MCNKEPIFLVVPQLYTQYVHTMVLGFHLTTIILHILKQMKNMELHHIRYQII